MAIDGLVSGLDTSSIIKSLLAVERAPQDAMVARQSAAKAALDAYTSIRSKLSTLATASAALSAPTSWDVRSATSSDNSTAVVSATPTAPLASLRFTVDTLATSHGLRSGNVMASTDDVIASSGTVQIDTGDGPQAIAVGNGTLAEVVAAISSAGIGLRAAAVNTGSGHRLQVTSESTGTTSSFTLSGLDASAGGTVVTTHGADAALTIGAGPGAYSVTSTSNTFRDLIPGVSVTAVSTSTTPVDITVADDVAAVSDKVKALVEAANAALSEIATRSAYNAETRTAASLNGDSSVRRATQELTRAMSNAVSSSPLGSVGLAGVKLERSGRFTFSATDFSAAYDTDPGAVRDLFARSGSGTGSVSFSTAGGRARAGTYDVEIAQAATQATSAGTATWPAALDTTIRVTVGAVTVDHLVVAGTSVADAATSLQQALDAADLRLDVTEDGSTLSMATRAHGSAATFDVAWDGATWSSHAGVDVAGTIGGVAATGVGQHLTIPTADPGLGGLSVKVDSATTGSVGTVTYGTGVAQRLSSAVARAIDLGDGYLTAAENGRTSRIETLQDSIDSFEVRLALRETRLRTYWSAMEVSLGNLQSQSSWLSGQLAGLSRPAS